jgi:transcriptional regulator with XRE-family HTH domain
MRTDEAIALGVTVRLLREEAGYSRAALAIKAKLSDRRLLEIEDGWGYREKDLIRIAQALGTSAAVIKGADGAKGLDARGPFRALKAKLEQLPARQQDELCVIFYQSFIVAEGSTHETT